MRKIDQILRQEALDGMSWQQQLNCWRAAEGGDKILPLGDLAEMIGVDRTHLSRVLAGERPTAGKVAQFLERIGCKT